MRACLCVVLILSVVGSVSLARAQSQEIAPEVHEATYCAGTVITSGLIGDPDMRNQSEVARRLFLADSTISATYKSLYGRVPEMEELITIVSQVAMEWLVPMVLNGNGASSGNGDVFSETLGCYESLLGFMSMRGLEVLSDEEKNMIRERAVSIYLLLMAARQNREAW